MKWTIDEIEVLKAEYPIKDANFCALLLNRTAQSVRAKASKLGIKRLNNICAFKGSETYDHQIKDRPLIRLEPYKGANVPINHKCNLCDNIWKISPSHALEGKGCNNCRGSGFRDNLPAILYLVELDIGEPEPIYKLGITNHTVARRLGSELKKFKGTICWQLFSESGKLIRQLEYELKRKYNDYQYNTELLKSGNTETFTVYINKPVLGE
jgi:hypothetical protein